MKREIILVRHGESHTNQNGTHQAGDQVLQDSLNENGITQMRALAERFGAVAVDAIVTSAYLRARETAHIINEVAKASLWVPVYQDDQVIDLDANDPELPRYPSLLREVDIPAELGGLTYNSVEAQTIKAEAELYMLDATKRYSNQENYYDLWRRAADITSYLERREEKTLVVVSHGGTIKHLIGYLALHGRSDLSLEQKISASLGLHELIWYDNTGVTVFTYEADGEGWQWPISDIDHLHPKYFSLMPEPKRLNQEDSSAEA